MGTVQNLTTPGKHAPDSLKLARIFTAIYDCIDEYRTSISFVNLMEFVGDDGEGDMELESVSRANVFYWGKISQEFAEAITALMAAEVLNMRACVPLVYMIDGCMPQLPLADDSREFETPHWQPVVFEMTTQGAT